MDINRRQFLTQAAMAATIGFMPISKLWGAINKDGSRFMELRNGTGFYTNRGGTIGWFIHEDALVVIDTQFQDTASEFLKDLKKRTTRSIDILINTHHHRDHTGGNPVLKPHSSITVAQKNVPELQKLSAQKQGTLDQQVYADTLFETQWIKDLGNEKVTLTYFGSGHTNGDSITHFENANVVHMGDLIFNRIHPYIDTESGGSILHWKVVLDQVLNKFDSSTIFIFGHGKEDYGVTGDINDIKVLRDYFVALQDHVTTGINKGMSRDEITNIKELKGFENFQTRAEHFSLPHNLGLTYDEIRKS